MRVAHPAKVKSSRLTITTHSMTSYLPPPSSPTFRAAARYAVLLAALPVLWLLPCRSYAQRKQTPPKTAPDTLTLKRVYESGEFQARSYSARWLGEGFVRWERSRGPNGGSDLAIYTPQAEGEPKRDVLIRAERLVPPGAAAPLSVSGYTFSKDQSKVLICTNTQRVWRQNTRGDYWVLDRSSHELRQIGAQLPPSSLMFAKLSPDGRHVAFVHNNDLWLQATEEDSEARRLTTDGSETIINGTFDWVYEEELSLRDGFRWSPDGNYISFWQLDSSGVRKFPLVNNTAGLYPEIQWIPYPKTGQRNSAARIGLLHVKPLLDGQLEQLLKLEELGKQLGPTWLKLPGHPRENYLARMEWLPEKNELIIQQLNRLQNRNRIYRVGVNGAFRQLFVESDEAWVEIQSQLTWRNEAFLWLSERSGYRRLYWLDAETGALTPLTEDMNGDVIDIVRLTDDRVYFTAAPDNATQRQLYSVSVNGSHLQRVTPSDEGGTHQYQISPDGKWSLYTVSQFDVPPTSSLITLPDHEPVHRFEENKSLQDKLAKLGDKRPVAELFSVEIEPGVLLDGWCIRPRDLEKGKKYPLIVYVYGEPAGTTVRDSWGGSTQMWHRMLAQQGYVVMSFDNRGTPAPKGRAWRKACYRQVGVLAPKDQEAAVRKVLADRPYLDARRVGVWGWSGGGSMTLNALFKFPQTYHVGISIAPVPNQRLYDTIYQERYQGLPRDNPRGYHDGSPLNFASQLKGELLLIHGTGDDNCHYQGAEALIDELVRYNKPFTMMSYPNRSHSIREGVNTSRHLRALMTRFFLDKLEPGPQ